jgi:hypothetical protein
VLVADHVVVFRGPIETSIGHDLEALRTRLTADWQALAQGHVTHEDPRHIVANGYNQIAERYAQWSRDALGRKRDPGTIENDWLGAPMYFSAYAPAESRRSIEEAASSTPRRR